MAGGGGELESHKDFSLRAWSENRGTFIESLTWSIGGATGPDFFSFDAERKKLFIDFDALAKLGIEVETEEEKTIAGLERALDRFGVGSDIQADYTGQLVVYTGMKVSDDGKLFDYEEEDCCAGCNVCGAHCIPDCPSGNGQECQAKQEKPDGST